MPILAAFVATLFGNFVAWLGAYFTKRTANYLVLVGLTAAAAAAMWTAATALLSACAALLPSFMTVPLTWLVPSNFDECLVAYLTTEVICAGYRWHRDTVRASAAA